MEDIGFGEILRQTRERKGLDLTATARRLRIRPDILRAIEDGNFHAMPPRGYTRNMVNGYARYLGLNPTEITGMYLDELHEFERSAGQARRRPTGIEMPDEPERPHRRNERSAQRDGGSRRSEGGNGRGRRSGRGASDGARERRGSGERRDREHRSAKRGSSYADGLPSMETSRSYHHGARRYYPESKTHHSLGSVLPRSAFTDNYAGPHREDHAVRNRLPFVIAAVVLLALIIVIGLALGASNQRQAESQQVATMPVTGLESSQGSSGASGDASAAQDASAETAPTQATFTYELADGQESWIEVYVDGQQQVSDELTGPQSGSYTFTDTLQFVSSSLSAVTVTIDGEQQTLEENSKGIVNTTYKFSDILAKWQQDHGQASADSQAAASDSASSQGGSANASSGSTSGSAASSGSSSGSSSGAASGSAGSAASSGGGSSASSSSGRSA